MIKYVVECETCGEQAELTNGAPPEDWIDLHVLGEHHHFCSCRCMVQQTPDLEAFIEDYKSTPSLVRGLNTFAGNLSKVFSR